MLAEFSAIYHGLVMANDLGYSELACYFDSLVANDMANDFILNFILLFWFSSWTLILLGSF